MNIIHVFPIWSISKGGGTTSLIYEIAKKQSKNNKVTILTGSYGIDNDLLDSTRKYGINIIVSKSYLNRLGLFFMPKILIETPALIRKSDIIHLHLYRSFQNLVLILLAKFYKKPCIIDAHGSIPYHHIKTLKKRIFDFLFKSIILNNVSQFLAENELSKEECLGLGVSRNKIRIINPPFAVDEFKRVKNLNILENTYKIKSKYKILYFGRLHYIKGIDLSIKGFYELKKIRSDIHFVIMGTDDGFKSQILQLIDQLSLKNSITLIGFKKDKEKLSIIKESTLSIQTSRYEQGAGAPFESVLTGTPILVSDNSGCAEDVIRHDAGYICKFNDAFDFSQKADFILNNLNLANKKTIKASQKIKKFQSFNAANEEYLKCYKEQV